MHQHSQLGLVQKEHCRVFLADASITDPLVGCCRAMTRDSCVSRCRTAVFQKRQLSFRFQQFPRGSVHTQYTIGAMRQRRGSYET